MRYAGRGAAGPDNERPGAPGELDALGQDIALRLAWCLTGQFGQSNTCGYPLNRRPHPQISHQHQCGFRVNFSGVAALV